MSDKPFQEGSDLSAGLDTRGEMREL